MVMMMNPCSIMQDLKAISQFECQAFSNGLITQGMSIALGKYLENMRRILNITDSLKNDQITPQVNYSFYSNITDNYKYNRIINIFNTEFMSESGNYFVYKSFRSFILAIIQDIYLKNLFRFLSGSLRQSLSAKNNNTIAQRLAIFICFNVFLFIIYFLFWIPLISKLQKDVIIVLILLS